VPLPRWIRRASLIAVGVVLLMLSGYAVACRILDPRIPPTPERLERSMALAVDYLKAHTLETGRFVYEVNKKGEPVGKKYNVLRHAGTIYSLSMYHERTPSPELRELIVRAARYLLERHVAPVADLPGRSTIFSLAGEEEGNHRSAKLGAAGLGLIALIRARALDESVVGLEVLREIGEFILFMQQPDGSFRSKYSERIGFDDDFDSLYYPGEAILSLADLYEIDRDPRWLEAALRAVRSLIDRQRAMDGLPPDHWLMIATGKLATLYDQAVAPPVAYDEMLAHAVAIGRGMISIQQWVTWVPGFTGAFGADGRSTPSSTRLEGLIAVYHVLPPDDPSRPVLYASIESGVAFLLACQESDGPNVGGIREALRRTGGGADWRHVRIDYVQHALSAMIGWTPR
jgi:hypothetical protein